MGRTLIMDVETHSADLLHTVPPERFVRLCGYKWLGGDVVITTDLDELREAIRAAGLIVGFNIHAFDLKAVFGPDSDEPLELTRQGRVFDCFTHAPLVHPAPPVFTNRFGKRTKAETPDQMKRWFSLDEQAHQLGVPGKTADLDELAREYGGFGEIPTDDDRFREYLAGDVEATEAVARELFKLGTVCWCDEPVRNCECYPVREQRIAASAAVISSNGIRVDTAAAQTRRDELNERKQNLVAWLVQHYDLPDEGKAPWDTDAGKAAILAALADYGITPGTVDWPKTPVAGKRDQYIAAAHEKIDNLTSRIEQWKAEAPDKPKRSQQARYRWIEQAEAEVAELQANPLPPAFGLSLSGDTLTQLTAGTDAEELGQTLAELKGQRSLADLALESTHPDGFVHPEIGLLQRSGRWSTTKPGLTIWTARGEGAVEKTYFLPDNPDHVLIELDYSNADAREVAALSGDRKYAERFREGADGHLINAYAAWGRDTVDSDPTFYRQKAKPLGHGWSYGGQARTLASHAGVPLEDARSFCNGMARTFHVLVSWQNRVRKEVRNHRVFNDWGRPMFVEPGREFTQVPALHGQSGTREIVCDAILRLSPAELRHVKAQVHDAVLFSVPRHEWWKYRDWLVKQMETHRHPQRGQHIEFPVESGPPGENWFEAAH